MRNNDARVTNFIEYPMWLKHLSTVYSRTIKTLRRWYLNCELQVKMACVPYSFSWIKWEVEHNGVDPLLAIKEAPYGLDGLF